MSAEREVQYRHYIGKEQPRKVCWSSSNRVGEPAFGRVLNCPVLADRKSFHLGGRSGRSTNFIPPLRL